MLEEEGRRAEDERVSRGSVSRQDRRRRGGREAGPEQRQGQGSVREGGGRRVSRHRSGGGMTAARAERHVRRAVPSVRVRHRARVRALRPGHRDARTDRDRQQGGEERVHEGGAEASHEGQVRLGREACPRFKGRRRRDCLRFKGRRTRDEGTETVQGSRDEGRGTKAQRLSKVQGTKDEGRGHRDCPRFKGRGTRDEGTETVQVQGTKDEGRRR